MRTLVTGRDGQVARSLAERCPAGIDLVFAGRPEVDLRDFAAIERTVAAVRPDLIVSAAAYTAVDRAETDRDVAARVNGEAPGVLARAARAAGAPIIHLSTDYVFDGTLDRPYREDDPVAPLGVYGESKLAGEAAVRTAGADHLIVRTAWVYGPFGANFVKTMIRLAGERDSVSVVDDQRGCPTSSLAIADALYAVIARWRDGPAEATTGIFHFAGSGDTTWAGLARETFAISAAAGGPVAEVAGISTAEYPTPARRPANSRLDSTRFADAFGHQAPPWRNSLRETVDRLVAPAREWTEMIDGKLETR